MHVSEALPLLPERISCPMRLRHRIISARVTQSSPRGTQAAEALIIDNYLTDLRLLLTTPCSNNQKIPMQKREKLIQPHKKGEER